MKLRNRQCCERRNFRKIAIINHKFTEHPPVLGIAESVPFLLYRGNTSNYTVAMPKIADKEDSSVDNHLYAFIAG